MKIAITGGTGFIGGNLARALAGTDHETVIIGRHGRPSDIPSNIKYLQGDVHDPASMEKALAGVEVVFHLVGIIAETKNLTFAKTVVGGTGNVVAAGRKNGVRKIIYLSAAGTSESAGAAYFRSKWRAERAVIDSGIDYTIFRPSIIFGREDKFINRLADIIRRSPVVPIIGSGRYLLQPIYIADLVKGLTGCISHPGASREIIEAGGPERFSFREIIGIIKKILNRKRLNFYIPVWFIKGNAIWMERILKPAPITSDQLAMLKEDNICDNTKLLRLFDLKLTGLEDGLKEYMR